MQRLLELYRNYCNQSLEIIEHFEQIPSKILALCYDKDCTDFRFTFHSFCLWIVVFDHIIVAFPYMTCKCLL